MINLKSIAVAMSLSFVSSTAFAASCSLPANAAQLVVQAGQAMNSIRAQAGRRALQMDPRLQAAAQAHACNMSTKGYFSHRGKDGSKPKIRLKRQGCGAKTVAENIAIGQTNPNNVMAGWMGSPSHKKNILIGRGVDRYGLALAKSGNAYSHGYVWVQVFSTRCR